MKKRGRPPSKATLAKRLLIDVMSNPPPHIQKLTPEEIAIALKPFELTDLIEKEILATYRHGPWTPVSHALEMAALGDFLEPGGEESTLEDEARYSRRAKEFRKQAGKAISDRSNARRLVIAKKNKVLIEKIKFSRAYNVHKVAKIISEQWNSMTPAQKLHGEDASMSSRGDGGKRPSVRTITRWIELCESTFDKPRN